MDDPSNVIPTDGQPAEVGFSLVNAAIVFTALCHMTGKDDIEQITPLRVSTSAVTTWEAERVDQGTVAALQHPITSRDIYAAHQALSFVVQACTGKLAEAKLPAVKADRQHALFYALASLKGIAAGSLCATPVALVWFKRSTTALGGDGNPQPPGEPEYIAVNLQASIPELIEQARTHMVHMYNDMAMLDRVVHRVTRLRMRGRPPSTANPTAEKPAKAPKAPKAPDAQTVAELAALTGKVAMLEQKLQASISIDEAAALVAEVLLFLPDDSPHVGAYAQRMQARNMGLFTAIVGAYQTAYNARNGAAS